MADNSLTKTPQDILITISIVLRLPHGSDNELDKLIHDAVEELEQIIDDGAPRLQKINAHPSGSIDITWLDLPESNAGRCQKCSTWTTDPELPMRLLGMRFGTRYGDIYVCEYCDENPRNLDDSSTSPTEND